MPTISFAQVDQYWGQFLGCNSELVRNAPPPYLLTAATQPGLWALSCGGSWVVAMPDDWSAMQRAQIGACFQPNQLPNRDQLQPLLQTVTTPQLYGPALIYLHYPSTSQPTPDPAVRSLTRYDQAQIDAFAVAAGPPPWSLAEAEIWLKVFGFFVEGALVATCGVRLWGDLLAEIYVDTLPTQRRRGYGRAVTATALHWIHTATPYYAESVVELSNQPSLHLMQSLGFTPYGYMVTST